MQRKLINFYAYSGVTGFDINEEPVFRSADEELEKLLAEYGDWRLAAIVRKDEQYWLIVLEKDND